MLGRLDRLFDPGRVDYGTGVVDLIVSDYVAFYSTTPARTRWGVTGSQAGGSPRRMWLMFLPRVILNPCLHATILIRLTVASPRWMLGFWRTILIAKHTIDVHWRMYLGPGLILPHPYGISLGWGTTTGRNVTIMHNVNIGAQRQKYDGGPICPTLGDDVVVFMESSVLGPITVGDAAVIGAGTWVESDVPAGEIVRRVPRERVAD